MGGSGSVRDEVCAPPELETTTPGATSSTLAVIDCSAVPPSGAVLAGMPDVSCSEEGGAVGGGLVSAVTMPVSPVP